ncbi:hypothetical protein ACFPT7_05680 [Acidicapsa dinghuensis]|uniref:Uncharacterized protein n=1 Tax=Acidicapsa dinghuensis TaxID=2218256 RepID=A0ABW1ECQ4_9BACT|nr:hypothetical protein [Acidicapsa dinghuensis]
MKTSIKFYEAWGKIHPLHKLAVQDAIAIGILTAFTLLMFGLVGLYYSAYNRYRASLGLPTDNTPVITLPTMRHH